MKLRAFVLSALLVAACGVGNAFAVPGGPSVGLVGGMSSPDSKWSDLAGTAWFAGGYGEVALLGGFAAGVEVNYHRFAKKTWTGPGGHAESAMHIVQGGAYLKQGLSLPAAPVTPYLKLGVGQYALDDETTVYIGSTALPSTHDTESKLGINGGVGATLKLAGTKLGVEALYHDVFTKGAATKFYTIAASLGFSIL